MSRALVSYAVLLAIAGCQAPSSHADTQAPAKPPEKKVTINASGGEATELDANRLPLYHVVWTSAQIDVADQSGINAGTMNGVAGEMYEKGKVVSTFKADHAWANRAALTPNGPYYLRILVLTGSVTAESKIRGKPLARSPGPIQATMACDKLEWHNNEKIVKAFGHIRISGTYAVLSGLDEVWATPDLKYFATPSMFKRP